MQVNKAFPGILLIVTLLSLPFIVGSSCVVFFNSGGGSSNNDHKKDDEDKDDDKEDAIIVKSARFSAPATEGLNYESGTLTGVTGQAGEFRYEDGQPVQFSIGDLKLGTPVPGKPVMTPADLIIEVGNAGVASSNISRLLQSLDADRSDEVVSIPAMARDAAVRSDASVAAAIEVMDFSDEANFVNTASQLLSTLTQSYPFTATLVDSHRTQ